MPVLTLRPNGTVQLGSWTLAGAATGHAALSDGSDTTYIQNSNRCELDSQVAIFAIEDIDIPDGAKIFSVRSRARVEKVNPGFGVPSPLLIIIFVQVVVKAAITVNISLLFRILIGFICPRPAPSVVWETQELAYHTEQPAGGEWTEQSFNDFTVRLGRRNAGANAKVSAIYVDVDYNTRPVAGASGPTGTIADTTRPLVTWTYSDSEGDPQQAYRVRIFNDAQYLAGGFDAETSPAYTDSGWTAGQDLSWTVDKDLVNDTYRAYVMVEQVWPGIGQHRSAWSFVGWTQNVPGPPAPTVNATYEGALNRVRLDISRGGTTPPTETYNLERSLNLGVTWEFVRGGVQIVPDGAGAAAVYDHEAPLKIVAQYRVFAYRTLGSVKVGSDPSLVASVTPRSLDWWLKDPLAPVLDTVLPVADDKPNRPRAQGEYAPLVAAGLTARKIVVNGPPYGVEGELELIFVGDEAADTGSLWAAFNALRDTGRTLLLQYPSGEQHYIQLGDNLSWGWGLRDDEVRYRRATISYVEVTPPPDESATG